jgi:hypothetical protein
MTRIRVLEQWEGRYAEPRSLPRNIRLRLRTVSSPFVMAMRLLPQCVSIAFALNKVHKGLPIRIDRLGRIHRGVAAAPHETAAGCRHRPLQGGLDAWGGSGFSLGDLMANRAGAAILAPLMAGAPSREGLSRGLGGRTRTRSSRPTSRSADPRGWRARRAFPRGRRASRDSCR